MGMMNRMRENTGIVLWILVLSFGGLWVLQDSGVFDTIGVDPLGKVIIVDGDVITREEYNQQLEFQLEQIRQSTGSAVEPERLEFERERAFNTLVNDLILRREMDRIGITVSTIEIQELITGNNPHSIITANFAGEDGEVNRELLQSVIDAPEQEGTWVQIEEFIRQDRRRQKFTGLIDATVRVSSADASDRLWLDETNASGEFFFLRYAAVADSLVALTDRDVERFYNEHQEDFQRERVYTIELASLSKLPSAEDTTAVMGDLDRMRSGFESAEDDSAFVASVGSEAPWSDAFLGPADLDAALAEALFESTDPVQTGQVLGPVIAGGMLQLVKILETRPAEETNVRARHILIRAAEEDTAAVADARTSIQAVQDRLDDGESFVDLARELSDDTGSGAQGGDLGWFGDGTMVPAFQEAAYDTPVGSVAGPVQTQFGLHLIETTNRARSEVRIARLGLPMNASVATLNALNEALEDLSYFGEESGDFAGEASRRSIPLQTMSMEAGQTTLPGLGTSRALAKFLEDTAEGDTSPIIELNDVAIMAHVVEIQEEGTRPLDEVESVVRPQALLQKKRAYQRERMEAAYEEGGFDGLVQALAQQPTSVEGISLETAFIPGLGRDLTFAGTLLGLEEGEDSGVVEGSNAVFVVQTTAINEPALLDENALNARLASLSAELGGQFSNRWIDFLRESSDIEDLRTDLLPLSQ